MNEQGWFHATCANEYTHKHTHRYQQNLPRVASRSCDCSWKTGYSMACAVGMPVGGTVCITSAEKDAERRAVQLLYTLQVTRARMCVCAHARPCVRVHVCVQMSVCVLCMRARARACVCRVCVSCVCTGSDLCIFSKSSKEIHFDETFSTATRVVWGPTERPTNQPALEVHNT
jgi:hypothetical protein